MPMNQKKEQVLKENGYKYHFDRTLYFNRSTRKIFSLEFIEDHTIDNLKKCIESDTQVWTFYTNDPGISEHLKSEILNEIGK